MINNHLKKVFGFLLVAAVCVTAQAHNLFDTIFTMPGFLVVSNHTGRDMLVDTTLENYTLRSGQILHIKIDESFTVNHLELGAWGDLKDAVAEVGKRLERCYTLDLDGLEKDLQAVTLDDSTFGHLTMISTNSTSEGVTCFMKTVTRGNLIDLLD